MAEFNEPDTKPFYRLLQSLRCPHKRVMATQLFLYGFQIEFYV